LNGTALTLSQVNSIARVADSIPKEGGKKPWAIAIAQFKKSHTVSGGKWVKGGSSEKEFFIQSLKDELLLSLNDGDAATIVEKNDSGRYNITTISTAAVKDREDETFTVEAMDYDIAAAKEDGNYPEYRVFHSKHLGIGRVYKMTRVGIFAIDQGESYDDPFSLSVCEKMLANNNGKWRVSRGFKVLELSGGCPNCNSLLSISTKHMLSGYRCPTCDSVHLRFKGVLDGIRFTKARTFDVTVTDVPAVPYTGAYAWRKDDDNSVDGGLSMTKKELKERLLEAGIPEDAINKRLKEVTDKQLEQLGDIPMAEILKEFEDEDPEGDEGDDVDDGVVVEFAEMITAFKEVVRSEIEEALNGFQVEVEGFDAEAFKQDPQNFTELKEMLEDLQDKVDQLTLKDESRLKDMLRSTSRNGKVRILRMKEEDDDEDDEEDEEDIESLAEKLGMKKETLDWIQKAGPQVTKESDQIIDASGTVYPTLTAAIRGTED
jgi:hypothetical protein